MDPYPAVRQPPPTTTLEFAGQHVRYLVRTDVPLYQERIVKMGWWPTEDPNTFARRLDARGDVEVIHQRFACHLEEMILQSARRRPVRWEDGLELMLHRLDGSGIDWWVYGSAALAIRGLEIEPGDIDFTVSDAIRAGELFDDVLIEPVTHLDDWVADFIGRAFHGAIFEWLAGPHGVEGPHEQGPVAGFELEEVRWRDHSVWVPPLELQLDAALARGLHDRAAGIRHLLRG